jgi:hypothetical protein
LDQNVVKQETQTPVKPQVAEQTEKKKPVTAEELVAALKGTGDDIGQISELTSEENLIVDQFFISLLKLMQPLAPSIPVNQLVLPAEVGDPAQADIDPTGHLILQYNDGHVELVNLIEKKNRELMIAVISDILPKFKNLTSAQKRKLENRIKLLSGVTKEMQKISEALSAALSGP